MSYSSPIARLYGAVMPRVVPGVVVGGVVGTALRWAVLTHGPLDPRWATLLVNGAGSMLLGWVTARWPDRTARARLTLGVGVAGGLTTFSTLAVDVAASLDTGRFEAATLVVAANITAGLAGFAITRRSPTSARR